MNKRATAVVTVGRGPAAANSRVRVDRLDYILAVIAGVLLTLSFPRFGHPAFAWVALVPLLIAFTGSAARARAASGGTLPAGYAGSGALRGQPPLRALALSLVTCAVFFIGTVYWTGEVIITFGGVPAPVAAIGVVLMSVYLGLYHTVGLFVTSRVIARLGLRGLFFAPLGWVAGEYLRGFMLGGFPWNPLGTSQVTVLPVAQLASVFGVYGLSALIAYVNATVAFALLRSGRDRRLAIAAVMIVLLGIAGWGTWRIRDGRLTREGTPIRLGIIQPNIEQEAKGDPAHSRRIFTTNIAMTRDVVRRGAEYVIWPESALPLEMKFGSDNDPRNDDLRALAREVKVPILFGSDQQVPNANSISLYNAAFLLDPTGNVAAVYRKIHLVPFGEFIPLKEWFYFLSPLVESLVDFSPGDEMVMLPVNGHQTSTAICYEVVYPSLIRDSVLKGSELLTTITNDGWYGRSSAPYQHWAMASMRAIEQGRYLARAANTGISGVVDPYGRVVRQSAIFEQVGLVEEARFLTSRTVYAALGDMVAQVALGVTLLTGVLLWRR